MVQRAAGKIRGCRFKFGGLSSLRRAFFVEQCLALICIHRQTCTHTWVHTRIHTYTTGYTHVNSTPIPTLNFPGTSLVAQGLRLQLPMQRAQSQSLVGEVCSLPGASVHGIFQARDWCGAPLPSPNGSAGYINSNFPVHPKPLPHPHVHMSVPYICISIPATSC